MYEGHLNKWPEKVKVIGIRQALWPSPEHSTIAATINSCAVVRERDKQ